MKNIFVFIAFVVFSSASYSQTGWFVQNSGTSQEFNTVYFINDMTGFVSGGTIIYKTSNGGFNWIGKLLPDTSNIYSVKFENQFTGYACGGRVVDAYISRQYLFKTTNAGDNWTTLFSTSASFTSEYFFDVYSQNNIICLADGGYGSMATVGSVLFSTNNGGSFNHNYWNMYDESFEKLCFLNPQTGWVSAETGSDTPVGKRKIYRTTNGGTNWTLLFADSSIHMGFPNSMIVQFLDLNTGFTLYTAYGKAKFAKTTNGGVNWDSTRFQHQNSQALYFVNANTGWIGGNSFSDTGLIRRTINGGQNWQIQKRGNGQINSIYFVNDLTGWAVGMSGMILKTITGGLTKINEISAQIPDKFSLSQNYPNPFNPSTVISFQLPVAGQVSLKVIDILGKESATLVNEKLAPGTYSIDWNASQYPSGVYFYRLSTGDPGRLGQVFTETKRMVLIK